MCVIKDRPADAPPMHHMMDMHLFVRHYVKCLKSNNIKIWLAFEKKYDWEAIKNSHNTDYEILSSHIMALMIRNLCKHPFGHIIIEHISIHVLSIDMLIAIASIKLSCSKHLIPVFAEKMRDMGIYLKMDPREIYSMVMHFRTMQMDNENADDEE